MIFLQEIIDFLFRCIFVSIMTTVLILSALVFIELYFLVKFLFDLDYTGLFISPSGIS